MERMSQRSTENNRQSANWTHAEVLDLIAIWGEGKILATTAKGLKGSRQHQEFYPHIALEVLGYQWNWV